jgi:ankyrin repeat protein
MANNIGGKPPASLISHQEDTSAPATATPAVSRGRPSLSTRDPSPPTAMQNPHVLHQAAAKGDYPALLDALKRGISRVNEVDPQTGLTPLQAAQAGKHQDAVQLLVNAGARVHPLAPGYWPGGISLYAAAEEGNLELLAALPRSKTVLNAPDPQSGLTPLMFAIRGNHPGAVAMLLHAGARADRMDGRGRLPAVEAAGRRDTALLASLLESGASAQRPDNSGNTPLMAASLFGNLDSMTLVLEKGAWPDQPDSAGATALFKAVMSGSTDKVRLLLDHGADVRHADLSGRTPLMLAKQLPFSQEIVLLLEQHGA